MILQTRSSISLIVFILFIGLTNGLAQNKSVIKLKGANSLKSLKVNDQLIIRYIGDVVFEYENTTITCDSAYMHKEENWFDAYRNVVVSQESSKLHGEVLHFDGKTSIGELTGKEVRLVDDDATLITNTLYFNSKTNYAYYTTGGVITTKDSKLTSQKGYYFRNEKKIAFAGNVVMNNTDGDVFTDSLEYNTNNKIASFFGPTNIYNKDNYAYCEKGWHNRDLNQSNLQKNAYIISDTYKMFGEDIFYDKQNGFAKASRNIVVIDTVNRTYIYGDKGSYWEKTQEAEVTENPYAMMIDKEDTLFLRSDKLFLRTLKKDTVTNKDSTYKLLKALGNVKFFRSDLQGKCDSMIYNSNDSTLKMYVEPVLWNQTNQMSANEIVIFSEQQSLRQVDFIGSAFMISKETDLYFNQMQGKTIFARFLDGKLNKVDVKGNGQAVYFVKEKDTITMVNQAECSNISIKIKNNSPAKITFLEKPISNFHPISKIDIEEINLKGFKWFESIRPSNKFSIIPTTLILFPEEKGNLSSTRKSEKTLIENKSIELINTETKIVE